MLRNRTACKMLVRNTSKHNETPFIYKLQNISTWNMKFLLRQHNDYTRDEQPYKLPPIQIIYFIITARPDRPSLQAVRQDMQKSQLRGAGVRFGLWLCHTPVFMVTAISMREKKLISGLLTIRWQQSGRWEWRFACSQCPTGGSWDTHVWRAAHELIKHMRHFNL